MLGIKIISNIKTNIDNLLDNKEEYHLFGNCLENFDCTTFYIKTLKNYNTFLHIENLSKVSLDKIKIINDNKTKVSINYNNINSFKEKFFILPKFHRLQICIDSISLQKTFKELHSFFKDSYFKINGYLPDIDISIDKLENPLEDVNYLINKVNSLYIDEIDFVNYFFYKIINKINNNEINSPYYKNNFITNENLLINNDLNNDKCLSCQANLLCDKINKNDCDIKQTFYTELAIRMINNEIKRG